jgi:hypothetical protein
MNLKELTPIVEEIFRAIRCDETSSEIDRANNLKWLEAQLAKLPSSGFAELPVKTRLAKTRPTLEERETMTAVLKEDY